MSDRYMEKTLLYLLLVSLMLHIVVGSALYYFSGKVATPPKEPVFIDLQQMPELKASPRQQTKTKRMADQQNRVPREMAPRAFDARDSGVTPPQPESKQQIIKQQNRASRSEKQSIPLPRPDSQIAPGASVSGLLRKKPQGSNQTPSPQLFPAANRMAKLEENYRRKFEQDIAEGDTKFLNSDDIQFGSFLRRFENSVYGVWRYPQEAAMRGIEGIVPVRITFNRRGEVAKIQQLESSGAKILDEEVIRTLRAIGPIGAFPKAYDKDEFHLIAFFQYGGSRRSLR